jgi:hypothetical protein
MPRNPRLEFIKHVDTKRNQLGNLASFQTHPFNTFQNLPIMGIAKRFDMLQAYVLQLETLLFTCRTHLRARVLHENLELEDHTSQEMN